MLASINMWIGTDDRIVACKHAGKHQQMGQAPTIVVLHANRHETEYSTNKACGPPLTPIFERNDPGAVESQYHSLQLEAK